ncbi:hypothetical protein PGB90_002525 [Kerria lacca]
MNNYRIVGIAKKADCQFQIFKKIGVGKFIMVDMKTSKDYSDVNRNKLFEEHQDLLNLFLKFKELKTKEAQANSMELKEHATKVMNTLDEGIKQLDHLDSFFEYLTNVGASHRKVPGFKSEYFWKIESPFLEAVKTTLGDRYTENIENIYKITIKLIIESLVNGYDNSENKPLQSI